MTTSVHFLTRRIDIIYIIIKNIITTKNDEYQLFKLFFVVFMTNAFLLVVVDASQWSKNLVGLSFFAFL